VAPSQRPGYRPDVEGLRGVAIALVVLYHFRLGHVLGGYVGVDVFFVISGFVITAMLLREQDRASRISLIEFYARRVRRILPVSTAVLILTLIATALLIPPDAVSTVATDGRSAALFFANIRLEQRTVDLFTTTGVRTPFGHYWSLSIEEQFYFVWPTALLLIFGIASAARRRAVLASALVAVIAASSTLSILWTPIDRNAAFYSSFPRAGELAVGALIAVALPLAERIPPKVRSTLSWLGLAGIVACGEALTDPRIYPGALVLLPVGAATLVIVGGTGAGRRGATAVLGSRPMVALGAISYSLYLWHFPIITFVEDRLHHVPDLGVRLLLVALSCAIAVVSYRWFEDPIRRSAALARRRGLTFALGAGLVAASVITSFVVEASAH
jgi:peptidoglycan/LPS O-acetylase OafA/YrhL